MSLVDIIIVLILFVVVSLVIYFSFVKNRNDPCKGCLYSKSCSKMNCKK